MALIGSINNWSEIQGQINDANGVLTGVISSAELLGGEIVGMRGLKGEKGDTGDSGTFIAEYGVTTYDDLYDAFFDGRAIILKWQSAGYDRYFPVSAIYTGSSFKLTFLMGKNIAYDVEVSPFTPPFDWRYSSRNLQETLVSGTNIKTINSESLLGSGNIDIQSSDTKNVWYGTSPTNGANKVVTTSSGDFVLEAGNMLRVTFSYDNSYSATTMNVDGTGAKDVKCSGWSAASMWRANEVVDFVYDGTYFQAVNKSTANTSFYGLTILSDSTSDTSTTHAATAKAVKTAYDLANSKQDALVSGTNIKTINNTSLLGSGNIDIQGGGGDVTDVTVDGTSIVDSDGVAELETVTQLRNGLMDALDKQKLDGIASGAEVNVQSDWNEADSTADDYIKNKPTIPSKTSDLNNDSGFLSGSGILNMFYPVGSYYETSDGTFDPNVSWGGTWVLETAGQVHVSAGTGYTIGDTGGEATHTLTVTEIPSHAHTITSYYREVASYGSGNAARPYSKSGSSTTTAWAEAGNTGGGGAHNNMQPYIVVNRWHRTA